MFEIIFNKKVNIEQEDEGIVMHEAIMGDDNGNLVKRSIVSIDKNGNLIKKETLNG